MWPACSAGKAIQTIWRRIGVATYAIPICAIFPDWLL